MLKLKKLARKMATPHMADLRNIYAVKEVLSQSYRLQLCI